MLASFLQFCSEMFLKLPTFFVGWHRKHWHLDCGEIKKILSSSLKFLSLRFHLQVVILQNNIKKNGSN